MSLLVRARLVEACQSGEVLRIAYHAGSQPGAAREINPLTVADDRVLADDLATGQLRAFALAHVELLAPDAPARAYDPTLLPDPPDSRTIGELFGEYRADLELLGWHVEIDADHVTLHRFLKNGRPRKGAEIGLSFSPWTIDAFDDGDGRGLQEVQRPSKRPYAVRSPGLDNTRTFTALPRAVVLFWQQARQRAPAPAV